MAPDYPENQEQCRGGAKDNDGNRFGAAGIEAIAELHHQAPQTGPSEPQPKQYSHAPSLPYDDTSVNGAIDPEFTDEEGPLWDGDAGFPDEAEDEDDGDE